MLKQRGLSLIELMIAITLGLILLTGVMQVFLSSKNVFSSQQALSRVQETGRMAVEFLSRDIRMAGYLGCASRSESIRVTNTLMDSDKVIFKFNEAIRGYAAQDFPVAESKITKTIKTNTDVIVLRSAASTGVHITTSNDSEKLFVSDTGKFKDGDIFVATDCEKAVVFQASKVEPGTLAHEATAAPGNAIVTWGGNTDKQNTFNDGAQLLLANSTIYYIANGVSGRPTLYQSTNGASVELLEGVDDMRVTYGVDTEVDQDFIPNEYKLGKNVLDWKRVVSVRLELLVASIEDRVTQDHQVYTFPTDAASPTTATDFRLRQIYSTTIAIRNRIN